MPVIKHADEKSIKGIAREINELALKARNKQLSQEDMSGGTFTVNNTGTFGCFINGNYKSSTSSDFTSRIYCKNQSLLMI